MSNVVASDPITITVSFSRPRSAASAAMWPFNRCTEITEAEAEGFEENLELQHQFRHAAYLWCARNGISAATLHLWVEVRSDGSKAARGCCRPGP